MWRVAADGWSIMERQQVHYVWCPARHDTGDKGILSAVNKHVNRLAKAAVRAKLRVQWSWPEAWSDGSTLVWLKCTLREAAV